MLKVNLGCGTSALPDWENLDISYNVWLSKHITLKKLLFRMGLLSEEYLRIQYPSFVKRCNIIKGLSYENSSVEFIYTSQLLEYFTKEEAIKVLKECYRILKTGSSIRVCVLDLKILAEEYVKNNSNFFKLTEGECIADKFLNSVGLGLKKATGLARLYERYTGATVNKSMWDFGSLSNMLTACGFKNIEKKGFMEGRVPDIKILDNRPEKTLYVEAIK